MVVITKDTDSWGSSRIEEKVFVRYINILGIKIYHPRFVTMYQAEMAFDFDVERLLAMLEKEKYSRKRDKQYRKRQEKALLAFLS